MERYSKVVVAIGLVVIAVFLLGVHIETKKCEALGGKRMRGVLEGFKCYDVGTLKVLPASPS